MRARPLALAAFVAVVAAGSALPAGPAGAGASAALDGVVACSDGTTTVTWTIENLTQGENSTGLGGQVVRATSSGAATADVTASFAPNPFNFDDRFIIGSSTLPGHLTGPLTLDVEILFTVTGPFDFSFETSATVVLDGCGAPPEPTTSPSSSAAASGATRPAFTG
jgi:hypothetical protein